MAEQLRNHAQERNKQLEATIEKRLQKHLTLTDVAVEEPESSSDEEDEDLPEITPEMKAKIAHAINSNGETLIDAFNIPIAKRDIDTLRGLNWLNDEIINFYMQMICERSKTHDNWPNVFAHSTFFYPRLVRKTKFNCHCFGLIVINTYFRWKKAIPW